MNLLSVYGFVDRYPFFNLCIVVRKHWFTDSCKSFKCWHFLLCTFKKLYNTTAAFIVIVLSAGKFSDSWCHNCGFQNSDFCPEAWILPSTINIVSFFFPLQCQAYFFWEIISQSLDKHTLLIPKWQWLANAVGLTYTSFTNASLEVTILVHFHQQCLVQALRRCILERWIYYMDRFLPWLLSCFPMKRYFDDS